MSNMNRTTLAFIVAFVLAGATGALAATLSLSSWLATALGVAAVLLATLVDRDGFYGPRDHPHQRS